LLEVLSTWRPSVEVFSRLRQDSVMAELRCNFLSLDWGCVFTLLGIRLKNTSWSPLEKGCLSDSGLLSVLKLPLLVN
jgi:hypothetical protein